jgi:uncharacterized protein
MSSSQASGLPVTVPDARALTVESRPFWAGLAAGQLRLQRCGDCAGVVWYPRGLCPRCGSVDLAWFTASGQGIIYSFTVVRRAPEPFGSAVPYVVAYVELDEGPRVLTNIVHGDPELVRIGQPVQCVFDTDEAGLALLRFRPAPGDTDALPICYLRVICRPVKCKTAGHEET